jgi:hypothetical protein
MTGTASRALLANPTPVSSEAWLDVNALSLIRCFTPLRSNLRSVSSEDTHRVGLEQIHLVFFRHANY